MKRLPPKLKRFFDRAKASHKNGKLADAERLYLKILNKDRSHFPTLHSLSMLRWQQGNASEALRLLEAALRIYPSNVEALSNYAVVLNGIGRPKDALDKYDAALAFQPDYAEIWTNRGIVLQQLRRYDEAIGSYDRALAIRPNDLLALNNRGFALHELSCFERALDDYNKALAIAPGFLEALNNRGITLRSLGCFDDAVTSFDKALALRPDYAQALSNRGLALNDLGLFENALVSFNRALSFVPHFPMALNNRGNTLWNLNRIEEALASYDLAITIVPDYAEALFNRGNVLRRLGRLSDALDSYERASTVRPAYFEALNYRGLTLFELNRPEEALDNYNQALAIKSDYPEALNNRGNVLAILGKMGEARSDYEASLRLRPTAQVYFNYANSTKFESGNRHLGAMQAMRNDNGTLTDTERLHLDFALAKAFDDLGDPERSFRHLVSGNALKRAQIGYDEAVWFEMFDRIENVFTPALVKEMEQWGGRYPSPVPIFILGMTRSGSTLVEQILASHPQVYGAGEMGILTQQMGSMRGQNDIVRSFPDFVPDLDASTLRSSGATYIQEIRRFAPTASRITDKMPGNFIFCGLIHLMLPNARIIHTVRDPVDTCFSSFSKLFTEGLHHTYDLTELGRYYRRYQKVMEHWRQVLPPGRILDVHYEEVTANLEGQARRIIAHCGLEWNAQCLSFHTTNRPIKTFSHAEVRQPIYRTSVGRSDNYREFLQPLIDTLRGKDLS